VRDAKDVTLAIVSPDGRDGMLQHARELAQAGIPFVFDPGQGLPMFSGEELLTFIRQATYVTVNDYEGRLLQERTGMTLEKLAREVEALVVTQGAEGSVVYTGANRLQIPAVSAERITDPTGCGDAYRAGLLYGLAHGLDWPVTGRLASLLGSIKIASRGGQNHRFTRDEIADRFHAAFRMRPW
jgi:adenosine kinase